MADKTKTFPEFYKYYLTEHQNRWTRIFHFVGTFLLLLVLFYVLYSGKERFLWYVPIFGYGFAWFSHVVFEKNRPATFKYPLWSLFSDFKMFFELLTGKIKF